MSKETKRVLRISEFIRILINTQNYCRVVKLLSNLSFNFQMNSLDFFVSELPTYVSHF